MSDSPNNDGAAQIAAETAWRVICAKIGQPDAADVRANGTVDELHEKRKTMRRAINKLNDSIGVRDIKEDEAKALAHAGVIISRIEGLIDSPAMSGRSSNGDQSWSNGDGKPVKQLRTLQDFEAHYGTSRRGTADDDISLADFFRGVANMPTTPAVRNALSVGTNSAGGFTLPNVVMPKILGALGPNSALLQAGMPIVPLDMGAKTYTTAVVSGIPTAAWRLEAGNVAESDPVFTGVAAAPQSLAFFFKISRELLADSTNLNSALLTAIGQAMGKELDRAGLRGTGVAPQPRGILNTSGIQAVTNGANGTSLASYANLLSAVQALLTDDAPMPTAAIMHPRSLVKLGGLLDTTNQPLRRPPMLDEVPMLTTSQIPINLTVGTSNDCSEMYMGDFSKIAMMLRESLSVQLLSELYAGTGQVAFMCHCRADFAVMYPAAFAVVTGIRA